MSASEILNVIFVVATLLALIAPKVGRSIAHWKPRFAEGLIRFGADMKGLSEAIKLPPGTPSVSAAPVHEVAPSSPRKPLPLPTMPPMPIILLALLCSCVPILGCTPQQARDARDGAKVYGVPSARIAGAVCEMIGAATGADIEFLCTMAEAAGSVLGNLDSEGGPTITMPLRKGDKFTIVVRADEAEAFAEYHKAPGS